jgi:hypothetical protein
MQIRRCAVVVLADMHARERGKDPTRAWSMARLTGGQQGGCSTSRGVAIGGGGDGEVVGARMREGEGCAEGLVAAVLG